MKHGKTTRTGGFSRMRKAIRPSFFILLLSFAMASAPCASATPAVTSPYTFIGRVMDASHKAFDANRMAKVEAYSGDGERLSSAKTFFREGSRRNYSLAVPMTTAAADGYVVQNDALEITATDDVGKTWRGVVVGATAGAPGAVREVDIVLGEDANGDGIDDSLYAQLEAEWEWSEYWKLDETFDPRKDYDGDGVSTIDEALSGTNPFDPGDVLRITAFSHSAAGGTRSSAPAVTLSFDAVDGRSYSVEEATDLKAKDWKRKPFSLSAGGEPVNYISRPADNRPASSYTVYLLPSNTTNGFYRVKSE